MKNMNKKCKNCARKKKKKSLFDFLFDIYFKIVFGIIIWIITMILKIINIRKSKEFVPYKDRH